MPDGEVGEIWVRGASILTRYWRDEAATAAAITDGWFHTGDMARIDGDGLYWFADRLKHVIISGGENIYPAELEQVLRDLPGLAEFAVVGRDDTRWGQVPVVVAVTDQEQGGQPIDRETVLAHFDGELARFKHPKDVLFVEALPRNALARSSRPRCGRYWLPADGAGNSHPLSSSSTAGTARSTARLPAGSAGRYRPPRRASRP